MQTELSFSVIFSQSINFVKNRFWQIVIICALLALFSVFLSHSFIDQTVFEKVSNPESLKLLGTAQLLNIVWRSVFVTVISSLFLSGCTVAAIYNLSINPSFNIPLLVSNALSNILKILNFYLVYAFILLLVGGLLGLVSSFISMISPSLGSLISILLIAFFACFAMSAYYFFLGSIVEPSVLPFFARLTQLHHNLKKYWKLATLMTVIRILAALFIGEITAKLDSGWFIAMLISTIVNLIDFVVICFFYRLYTLIGNNHSLIKNENSAR